MSDSVSVYIASLKNLDLQKGGNLFIHSNIALFGSINIKFNEQNIITIIDKKH